ncbi:hypothetical protein B0H17DRAFT_1085907 [Mycena rosella]|uniref:NADH:flavin oxidoreductase/NADH oxidase N-terminal domain-containing protein n=1 Tax=Mycena rosella TaxID=1033263 RepID=A0AAD7CZ11_MYCRO|nr:hypothetical protein B0H17DRAFT_1085907 [Mycena rosella]
MSETTPMDALFTPLTLGDVTITNRIGMSAMTRNRADQTRVPSSLMKKYYLQRALGGAGLIVTEATLICPQGSQYNRSPGIWNMDQVAGWRKITNVVHLARSRMYCQLWHMGRLGDPDSDEFVSCVRSNVLTRMIKRSTAQPVYGPSAIPAKSRKACFHYLGGTRELGPVPTEIPDPSTIVAQFKNAAIHAKLAGFDGVELLAGNGFLVDQFLDSGSNIRTDQWGGSPENRARFGLEILKALGDVFGPNVSMKISPGGGLNDMGMPLEEAIATFSYFVSEADKLKLSYIVFSRFRPQLDVLPEGKPRGTPHDLLATYGKLVRNAKTFVVGAVTPAEAENLVTTGQVDGVFFGTLWITHPDLAKRIRHGKYIDNLFAVPHLYGDVDVDPKLGYTDYPTITY